MSTLPAPIIHVSEVHVHLDKIPADDAAIERLRLAALTDIAEANFFRTELKAALGLRVDAHVSDEELVAATGTRFLHAEARLGALERVSDVVREAHTYTGTGEMARAVMDAIVPPPPSNAVPTPITGVPVVPAQGEVAS